MTEVKIQFVKTHPDAQLPTKAYEGDNCWDLYATEDVHVPGSTYTIGNAVVPVGLSVGFITPGYGFAIKGRSGLGFKHGIVPHFGEIDNGYRGDLGVKLYNLKAEPYQVRKGDRIAQIKVEKIYSTEVEFIDTPDDSERGANKFGSSGA